MKKLSYKEYLNKVYGCFLGKTVIGTLGAPFEGVKMPLELPFKREMIDAMIPNDDLDLQVLWLDVLEKHGTDFTSYDLLKTFVECCDYNPGEYCVMRKNYMRGIYPPLSGRFSNDYYINGMGCPIRSEIWACISPFDPAYAADISERDGVLDHEGESVYSERFFAALESAAFFESDLKKLIEIGLRYVPENCRFRQLVLDTVAWCDRYDSVKLILRKILTKYGHPDCTNMFENVGIILAALLKCDLDLIKTGMEALNCGFDTDCTCATAGAIVGLIRGADDIIKEYDLKDVRYVLGVRSDRRSDSVYDLSEDIAMLGAYLANGAIEGAPEVEYSFVPSMYPLKISAEYENNDPTFSPVKPCRLTLVIENISSATVNTDIKVKGLGFDSSFEVYLPEKRTERISLEIAYPESETAVSDKNLYSATYCHNGEEKEFIFGVVGAMPWKAIGPIWRTDPICTTELLLEADLKYRNIVNAVEYDGNMYDVKRRFHLNCAIDTETEYLTFDECFTPYKEDAETKFEEAVFYQTEDSFRFEDICGFAGPSVLYLARELVCPEDRTMFMQIGNSAPFTLWLNGEKLAERHSCDTWDAENVHLDNVKMKKGVNKLLLRLTKVNGDTKFNVALSKANTCCEHYVDFAAIRPEFFK